MADWLPELGDDDLATLMDALEAWEAKDASSDFMLDVLAATMTTGSPRDRASLEEKTRAMKLKWQREQVVRKERSVLLRAKLLTWRDRRRVDQVIGAPAPARAAVAGSED